VANAQLKSAVQHIRKLVATAGAGRLPDHELLERFVKYQDETAFAALLQRHGPMVLRVCQCVLHHIHDAEDACQAAFLVLARKASSVRNRASIGSWLHGVALHVASNLRRDSARRRAREDAAVQRPTTDEPEPSWREAQTMLDEELQRLPEHMRAPLFLCYLEGKTQGQAARELGWSLGTLRGRLQRGRDLLRRRLTRRGLTLPTALLAALVSQDAAGAALPLALELNTARAALLAAGGQPITGVVSVQAVALAEGILKVMRFRLRIASWLLLVVGSVALGVGLINSEPSLPANDAPPGTDVTLGVPKAAPVDVHNDPLPPGALARMGTVRWRHGGAVFFVGLIDNGKRLITVSEDGWCRILDTATGKELRRFGKSTPKDPKATAKEAIYQAGAQEAVVLSADGRLLATLGYVGAQPLQRLEVHVWDVAAGKELWSCPWKGPNSGLAFSADSATLMAQGWEGIHQWDAATGMARNRFPVPGQSGRTRVNNGTHAFTFSPDGNILAGMVDDSEDSVETMRALEKSGNSEDKLRKSGSLIRVVKLWDVNSGKLLHQIKGKLSDFPCLAFSPNGKYLALPRSKGSIHLWDVSAGKEVGQFQGPAGTDYPCALAFSADGQLLASKSTDRIIRLWDVKTFKQLRPLEGPADPPLPGGDGGRQHSGMAQVLVFSPDGKVLFSGSNKYLVRRWDVTTGHELQAGAGHTECLEDVIFSPDGKTLTTKAGDGIRQWDGTTGKETRRIELPKGAGLATFAPDGRTLAFVSKHAIRLWDLNTHQEKRQWKLPGPEHKEYDSSWLYQMCLSDNGKVLAAKNYEHLLRLWDTASGKEIQALPLETSELDPKINAYVHESCFALSPEGTTLVRIEQIGPGFLPAHGDWPVEEAKALARISKTAVLRFYDVASGKKVRQVKAAFAISACVFAPDGRTLVTLNDNHTLSIWETVTGQERCQLRGGSTLAFSPDGRTVAVGSGPVLKLYSVLTGKVVCEFQGHLSNITTVKFAADGKTVATGSSDTTVLVWDVAGPIAQVRPPLADLTLQQVEALWGDLAAKDASTAWRAMQTLAASPKQATAGLQKLLQPIPEVPAQRLAQWLADLGSDKFAVRQNAMKELEQLGELAEPALKEKLASAPGSLEISKRIEILLAKPRILAPDALQRLRAVQTLEFLDIPEARRLLQALAQGAQGAQQTKDARAALERLGKHHPDR
jgi:RNA polymerase sigma factor (sigma-70 family)